MPNASKTRQHQVLVTGFEPFGGDRFNPSMAVALALQGERLMVQGRSYTIRSIVLPCEFAAAVRGVDQAVRKHQPVLALSLGLAADRVGLSFERVAINWIDARIADNAGAQPIDAPVMARIKRAAYFTDLPIKAMAHAASGHGVPATLSTTAGTYVCNAVMFALLHAAAASRRRGMPLRAGFCHLGPSVDMHQRGNALPLDALVGGVRAALSAALGAEEDLHAHGGSLA